MIVPAFSTSISEHIQSKETPGGFETGNSRSQEVVELDRDEERIEKPQRSKCDIRECQKSVERL